MFESRTSEHDETYLFEPLQPLLHLQPLLLPLLQDPLIRLSRYLPSTSFQKGLVLPLQPFERLGPDGEVHRRRVEGELEALKGFRVVLSSGHASFEQVVRRLERGESGFEVGVLVQEGGVLGAQGG